MNRHDVRHVQQIMGYPCISITLPTHRTSPQNKQSVGRGVPFTPPYCYLGAVKRRPYYTGSSVGRGAHFTPP